MVSTRQMSNVGHVEGSGANEHGGGGSGCGRVTRHSAPTGGSSPHHQHSSNQHPGHQPSNHQPSSSKSTALALPSRVFTTNLLDLPVEVLEKIFHFLGYKSVSQLRMVNRQFNTICSSILNSSFQKLQNQMLQRFHSIKSKMPRRESARRSHPLACESDIIETLHMRLSLLQMTFGKHIERKHCCFFPGEILDEVYSILSYLNTTVKLARPYKVTDELFDLTTMAMEYFKEHIEPNLPEITYFGSDFFDITNTFSPGESSKSYICVDSPPPGGLSLGGGGRPDDRRPSSLNYLMEESLPPSPPPPQSNMVLRKRIHRIKQGMKKYNDQLESLRSDLRSCKRKTALQQRQIAEQQKQLAEQQKQTVEYATRLDDYDKKNEETSRKFQTLLQELNKCKTELQYWRSRSPAVPPVCAECGLAVGVMPPLQPMQEVANAMNEAEAGHSAATNEVEAAVKTVTLAAGAGAGSGGPGAGAAEAAREGGPGQEEAGGPSAGASTPLAARRRPSADGAHPLHDRKKRRLTRPRKICMYLVQTTSG